jgi:hypothetical protein
VTPFVADPDFTLYVGDVRDVLLELPDESVHCVVTSPPYWGLRDYGTGIWEGGEPDCEHAVRQDAHVESSTLGGGKKSSGDQREGFKETCPRCGAQRLDQQLGLEPTPDAYVQTMVDVFREVRRVLRRDGTCWLNLGDSYNAHPGTKGRNSLNNLDSFGGYELGHGLGRVKSLKPKDLVGIPWSLAKALQAPYYTGRITSESDRVWLAATIDGEGTICGTTHTRKDDGRTRTMPQVFITNSSQAMLDEAQRIWPTSQSEHSRPGNGHLGTADVYRWIVHGIENKTMLLRELYPHLIVKKKQAFLAYNLLILMADAKRLGKSSQAQEVRDKREHLCRLMSRLNHAEDVDPPSWCMPPEGMWERGWFLRSEIIWAKLDRTPCLNPSPIVPLSHMSRCSC